MQKCKIRQKMKMRLEVLTDDERGEEKVISEYERDQIGHPEAVYDVHRDKFSLFSAVNCGFFFLICKICQCCDA